MKRNPKPKPNLLSISATTRQIWPLFPPMCSESGEIGLRLKDWPPMWKVRSWSLLYCDQEIVKRPVEDWYAENASAERMDLHMGVAEVK